MRCMTSSALIYTTQTVILNCTMRLFWRTRLLFSLVIGSKKVSQNSPIAQFDTTRPRPLIQVDTTTSLVRPKNVRLQLQSSRNWTWKPLFRYLIEIPSYSSIDILLNKRWKSWFKLGIRWIVFCYDSILLNLKGLCQLESMRSEVMQITFNCQNSIVFNAWLSSCSLSRPRFRILRGLAKWV